MYILYKARVGKHSSLALCVHVHVVLCTFTLSCSTLNFHLIHIVKENKNDKIEEYNSVHLPLYIQCTCKGQT